MMPTTRYYVTEAYYVLWGYHRIAPRVDDVVEMTGLPRGTVYACLWRMGIIGAGNA